MSNFQYQLERLLPLTPAALFIMRGFDPRIHSSARANGCMDRRVFARR
jgi:hypothetical protein